jgi:hypothetical protein
MSLADTIIRSSTFNEKPISAVVTRQVPGDRLVQLFFQADKFSPVTHWNNYISSVAVIFRSAVSRVRCTHFDPKKSLKSCLLLFSLSLSLLPSLLSSVVYFTCNLLRAALLTGLRCDSAIFLPLSALHCLRKFSSFELHFACCHGSMLFWLSLPICSSGLNSRQNGENIEQWFNMIFSSEVDNV